MTCVKLGQFKVFWLTFLTSRIRCIASTPCCAPVHIASTPCPSLAHGHKQLFASVPTDIELSLTLRVRVREIVLSVSHRQRTQTSAGHSIVCWDNRVLALYKNGSCEITQWLFETFQGCVIEQEPCLYREDTFPWFEHTRQVLWSHELWKEDSAGNFFARATQQLVFSNTAIRKDFWWMPRVRLSTDWRCLRSSACGCDRLLWIWRALFYQKRFDCGIRSSTTSSVALPTLSFQYVCGFWGFCPLIGSFGVESEPIRRKDSGFWFSLLNCFITGAEPLLGYLRGNVSDRPDHTRKSLTLWSWKTQSFENRTWREKFDLKIQKATARFCELET